MKCSGQVYGKGTFMKKSQKVFIVIIIVIVGVVLLGMGISSVRRAKKADAMWRNWIRTEYSLSGFDSYDSMTSEEQLRFDYRVLLHMSAERQGYPELFSLTDHISLQDTMTSYVKQSKGLGTQSEDTAQIVQGMAEMNSYEADAICDYLEDSDNLHLAYIVISYMEKGDMFLYDLEEDLFPEEMLDGCERLLAVCQIPAYVYPEDHSLMQKVAVKARSYLELHAVRDYQELVDAYAQQMKADYLKAQAAVEAKEDESADEKESEKSESKSKKSGSKSSGSGGGAGRGPVIKEHNTSSSSGGGNGHGTVKGSSGSKTGQTSVSGSGPAIKEHNTSSGSGGGSGHGKLKQSTGSGSDSSSSGSSEKKSSKSNGWKSYDDGYDAIMYDEDYDAERYENDREYANGVDDALEDFDEDYP